MLYLVIGVSVVLAVLWFCATLWPAMVRYTIKGHNLRTVILEVLKQEEQGVTEKELLDLVQQHFVEIGLYKKGSKMPRIIKEEIINLLEILQCRDFIKVEHLNLVNVVSDLYCSDCRIKIYKLQRRETDENEKMS